MNIEESRSLQARLERKVELLGGTFDEERHIDKSVKAVIAAEADGVAGAFHQNNADTANFNRSLAALLSRLDELV